MKRRLCAIYRSPKNHEMYLFVDKAEGMTRVPPELLQRFGTPELAMTLFLSPERRLARVDVDVVMQAIDKQGFFLQLPPRGEEYMQSINQHNDKL